MATFEGGFQRKDKEIPMGSGLNANSSHHLAFSGAGLVLQEEIVFKEGKVWENDEVNLIEMDGDCDLENGVQIQVDKLNLEMIEQAVKEIAGRESESVLEEWFRDYDFFGIGGWDILILGQSPWEDGMRRKKVAID
jgi:hypothetical protein